MKLSQERRRKLLTLKRDAAINYRRTGDRRQLNWAVYFRNLLEYEEAS